MRRCPVSTPKTGIGFVDEAIEAYQDAATDLAHARYQLREAQAKVERYEADFSKAGDNLKAAIDSATPTPSKEPST